MLQIVPTVLNDHLVIVFEISLADTCVTMLFKAANNIPKLHQQLRS